MIFVFYKVTSEINDVFADDLSFSFFLINLTQKITIRTTFKTNNKNKNTANTMNNALLILIKESDESAFENDCD